MCLSFFQLLSWAAMNCLAHSSKVGAWGFSAIACWAQQAIAEKPQAPTFDECAKQFIAAHESSWKNDKHIAQWKSTLKNYCGPVIGKKQIDEIAIEDVLKVLTPIWTSKPETASRLRGRIEKVLGWAQPRTFSI